MRQNQQVLGPWVKPPSITTQFVVGPAGETARELLTTVNMLYQEAGLARAYYSPFNPIRGTVLENAPKTPLMREHRLYEADWLIRNYGFGAHEIVQGLEGGNLDLEKDPKLAWALRHRHMFPVDVNRASRSLLLRIPGIGIRNVDRLVKIRRHHRIRLADLARLRVSMNRARWFVVTADHNPDVMRLDRADWQRIIGRPRQFQPALFTAPTPLTVVAGEI